MTSNARSEKMRFLAGTLVAFIIQSGQVQPGRSIL